MSNEINCRIKKMLDALDNDINFISLKQKYDSPNPFTIMGNKRREEWHSNFVRWILDPKQNHKLGTFPLLKFLELIESKNEKLKIDKKTVADMKFENEHKTHKADRAKTAFQQVKRCRIKSLRKKSSQNHLATKDLSI